ncbi:MAG TPA: hypothetical protein VN626_06520 [Clostridia bacterium]|nr:hypothetical protein [Clostridia bacterium]
MALPCAKNCSLFYEGCHKTCRQWQAQTATQREESRKIKAFLKEKNETSSTVIRQCIALAPRRTIIYY